VCRLRESFSILLVVNLLLLVGFIGVVGYNAGKVNGINNNIDDMETSINSRANKYPPEILTENVEIAYVYEGYSVKYTAKESEGNSVTWSLKTNASFLKLYSRPYTYLGGSPTHLDNGSYWVNITAFDGTFIDFTNFTLRVINLRGEAIILRTNEKFVWIQDAINNAKIGDTVFVTNGKYIEPTLYINKTINLTGENRDSTIIVGKGYDEGWDIALLTHVPVLVIHSDWVNVSGFTFKHLYDMTVGIELSHWSKYSKNCMIRNNYFAYFVYALNCSQTKNIQISENIFSNNTYGICAPYKAINMNISNNVFLNNAAERWWLRYEGAIFLRLTSNNIIFNNTFLNNNNGIYLNSSFDNVIYRNFFKNNSYGIRIETSSYWKIVSSFNIIINNHFLKNTLYGIGIKDSLNNSINYNNFTLNKMAICLSNSFNNSIYKNNFFNNTNQSIDNIGNNSWNGTYPIGGNFWSDYNGIDIKKGPDQNQSGSDGIGDTPYTKLSGNSGAKDHYPLMMSVDIGNFTSLVPFQPRNLKAKAGDGFINLTWKEPIFDGGSSIFDYILYRRSISSEKTYYQSLGNVLFFNDTNVTNDITYYYRVSAKNAIGEGPLSNEIHATPSNITFDVPSKPKKVQATSGDSYVQLTWSLPALNGNSTITNYLIYRATYPGQKKFYTQIGAKLNFNDTNVMNDVTYYYKVSAKNTIGEGALSLEVSATPKKTIEQSVPSYPRNFKATSGDKYVHLTWDLPLFDGNTSITTYRIYRGTTSRGKILLIQLGNITKYNDTNVTNGITYYYEVSAKNAIGEGPRSNEIIATPNSSAGKLNQTIPSYPQNLRACAGNKFVNLSWKAPLNDGNSTILNYSIYKGLTSGNQKCCSIIGNILFFNDTNVTNDVTYYYRVSVTNAIGEGPLSSEVHAKPTKPKDIIKKTKPSHPKNLHATVGNGFVNLTWNPPLSDGNSKITNYRIYKGTTSFAKKLLIELGAQLSYNDTNVTNGKTYYYEVAAKNAIGESPRSNEIITKPNATKIIITKMEPSHPRALQATSGNLFVNLSWDKPSYDGNSSITNYKIYKGITSGLLTFYKLIGKLLYFNDTNVIGGSTYYYRVSALNKIGEGALSNEVFATPTGSILTDTDLDSIPDYWERQYGLNILNSSDAQSDPDNDNLTNLEEFLNNTSPWNQDSDYDNLTDGDEIKIYGTSPTNPDTDGDGFNDGVEIANKTDPLDHNDYPKIQEKDDDKPVHPDDVLMYISVIILLITIIFLLSLFIIKNRAFKHRPKD
jgi:parallel beta-helix repeat protein